MSASVETVAKAHSLAKEARLCRESGHTREGAKLLKLAQTHYPTDTELQKEAARFKKGANKRVPLKRARGVLAWVVDALGLHLFFVLMAAVAWLLGPILLVPAS